MYDLMLLKAEEMIEAACITNKLTGSGSKIEMANIICGVGNMRIGGRDGDHNYHAILDAAYDLYKTKPDLEVDRIVEGGLRKAIDVFAVAEFKKTIIDLIIDQMEREKDRKAAFTLPCTELYEAAIQSIQDDEEMKQIFDQPQNSEWLDRRDEYIKNNFIPYRRKKMSFFSKFKKAESNSQPEKSAQPQSTDSGKRQMEGAVNGKTSMGIEYRIGLADKRGIYSAAIFGTSMMFPLPMDELSFTLGDIPVFAFLITEDEYLLKDKLSEDGEPEELWSFIERLLMRCPKDRFLSAKYVNGSFPVNVRFGCDTMDDRKLDKYLKERSININLNRR